ncbi:PepSY-associated TM helix domain-containing protein [Hydrocarboniphaga effusa]|uniref:PepSY domain-containing protein n=1 Tax=Hydrocarboniphaga effusa AP103 TaxID=1172194 RepID=I8T5L6_9GAMM|nr:PepSY domain-containing protein [Hydrocarboniphaga effusa]EIT69225.1 hypothetical protein WQQ_28070 [Hydrocarboniphaga effusa AP103]
MTTHAREQAHASRWPDYRTVWRWHFYAGLFCIPFVLWLAFTGTLYLFKPQIEAWLDAPYDELSLDGTRASVFDQVQAAVQAVPSGRFKSYELPATPQSAARVLVDDGTRSWRVYVHPQTLEVLQRVDDAQRPMKVISRLHGTLWLGDRGSNLVELAACWAIVMILSGLYLWWPRGRFRLGGLLWPRLQVRRLLLRDLHAVTGFWISVLALFLIFSGLPWAKFWGSSLKSLRELGSSSEVRLDWTLGGKPVVADEHAHHQGHHHHVEPVASNAADYERVVASVRALSLAAPVIITPPTQDALWSARSDAQNRPLRVTLQVDGDTGAIVNRQDFAQRALIDRIVGVGIAAHEGQLFGWINQLLGTLTTVGLMLLCVSAAMMWWKRRPGGTLGAPLPPRMPEGQPRYALLFFALVIALGVLLPLMGLSLLLVLAIERGVLRRLPAARHFLGLQPAA